MRHIWQKGITNYEFKSNKTNLVGGRGNDPDRTPKNHWQRYSLCGKSDDDTYWDISFPLERLPLSDLHRILEALDATDSQRDLSLPPEEDHADSVSSLSITVSQLLLRRNLGYDWECLHLAEDSFWILGVKDAPETNDFIKSAVSVFRLAS